ncbi:hypothetical protein K4K58_008198 [Colletotrichum sp. SAR11_239]|nr:hypothetical protein K4K58_008198 [Colletotrichum sp. SAR11_239]
MRSFVTCTVLASVASLASASIQARWEYPEAVPAIMRRQDPGTPAYACHENCGLLITLGRTDGFCDNAEWNTRYDACMACANNFGIWIYYRNGVTTAAEKCGLSPTPSPSGAAATTAAATSAAPAPSTAAEPAPTTAAASSSAAAPPAEESSSAPAATSAAAPATTLTTAASSAASSAAATPSASGTGAAGTSTATATRVTSIGTSVVIPSGTATPSSPVFAGASKNTGVLGAVGVVGLVLAAL